MCCVLGKDTVDCLITLRVLLSNQLYKLVLANLTPRLTQRWTSIPSRGSRNTPSRFMLLKPEISAGLKGDVAHMQTFRQGNMAEYC